MTEARTQQKVRSEPLIQLPREAWLLAGFSFLLALCVHSHTCVRTHAHQDSGWRGPCARVTSAVTPVLAAALTTPGLLSMEVTISFTSGL